MKQYQELENNCPGLKTLQSLQKQLVVPTPISFTLQGNIIRMVPEAKAIINYVLGVERSFLNIWHIKTMKCVPNELVLDIGANHGIYGIIAAINGCDTIMFDPQPSCAHYITSNILLNQRKITITPRVIQKPVLKSEKDFIYVHDQLECEGTFGAYGSLEAAMQHENAVKVYGANMSRLIGDRTIHLMKIDTEGGELQIINNMMRYFATGIIRTAVIELTTRFWKQRNTTRQTAYDIVVNLFRYGYDISVLECIQNRALAGMKLDSEQELKHMIVERNWIQCDFMFTKTTPRDDITFVIPSKCRDTLQRTVDSVMSIPSARILLVTDNCTTNVQNTNKIKSVHLSVKNGRSINSTGNVRNAGLKTDIQTKWVGFVDEDDTVSPHYVEYLKRYNADIVIFRMKDPSNGIIPPLTHNDTFVQNAVGISFAVKTSFYKTHNLYFTPSATEDFYYLDNARNMGAKIIIADEIAYFVKK